MSGKTYLGIDVGSVSTKMVAIDSSGDVAAKCYLPTQGQPILAVQNALREIEKSLLKRDNIAGVVSTGSGRLIAQALVGADMAKNEITAHATATLRVLPEARTIIEIGGQDSKIILLNGGVVIDFAMNTVCAAGTGSFLDRQAHRLGVPISRLGELALEAKAPTRIAGRCAVFAESDMIHKQQTGHTLSDIVAGLCEALVRNYLSNVGKGKAISGPVAFQGGVAANIGIRRAFEQALGLEVIVPKHFDVMGALGAAYLAQGVLGKTAFRGFAVGAADCHLQSENCNGCGNRCEVVCFSLDGRIRSYFGDRCGKYNNGQSVSVGY